MVCSLVFIKQCYLDLQMFPLGVQTVFVNSTGNSKVNCFFIDLLLLAHDGDGDDDGNMMESWVTLKDMYYYFTATFGTVLPKAGSAFHIKHIK